MVSLVRFVLLAAFTVTAVCAQDKERPNFSGTWERAVSNVNLPKTPGIKYKSFLRIVIDHVGPLFTVTMEERVETYEKNGTLLGSTRELMTKTIHYTDKRGETNLLPRDVIQESKTQWDGDEILVDAMVKGKPMGRYGYRYGLSKGGSKLTVTSFIHNMNPWAGKPFTGSRTFEKLQ